MNLANKITIVRLCLVPIYIFVAEYTNLNVLALVLFVIASFTDFLDGYIARKYNMVTDLGKFMDPLADKILTLSAFILFSSKGLIVPVVTIVLVMREIVISVFRAIAANKKVVIAASIYGKLKTVSQMSTIIFIYVFLIFGWELNIFVTILVAVMTMLTIISGVDYIYKNMHVISEK